MGKKFQYVLAFYFKIFFIQFEGRCSLFTLCWKNSSCDIEKNQAFQFELTTISRFEKNLIFNSDFTVMRFYFALSRQRNKFFKRIKKFIFYQSICDFSVV